jgi:hypothetical protein
VTHLPGTEPKNGHLLSIVKCNTAQLWRHCDVQHTAWITKKNTLLQHFYKKHTTLHYYAVYRTRTARNLQFNSFCVHQIQKLSNSSHLPRKTLRCLVSYLHAQERESCLLQHTSAVSVALGSTNTDMLFWVCYIKMLSVPDTTEHQPNHATFKIASNVQAKSRVALPQIKVDMHIS